MPENDRDKWGDTFAHVATAIFMAFVLAVMILLLWRIVLVPVWQFAT